MPEALPLPAGLVDRLRQRPAHAVLVEISTAARDSRVLATKEFKRLVAYILELADGRDRREPWTQRPGVARPVPKLRVAVDECFGMYGDLHWFRLNKTANASRRPLTGLYPRMAANLARIDPDHFAAMIESLLSPAPDASMLRFLHRHDGKVPGLGIEAFSRLASVYRPDLFFVIPKAWGESSGCLKFIGNDLRKYCALCRNMRTVCDELSIPEDIRASIVSELLELAVPPAALLEALHKAMGPSLAKFSSLAPEDGYEAKSADLDDAALLPVEFAAQTVRGRRGHATLREKLVREYGGRCAMTGTCLKDLLEVAYLLPYATEAGPSRENSIPLRADIHTLWDLNLIGIEASTRKLYVAPRLSGTIYEKLAGRTLLPRTDGSSVKPTLLRERWEMFVNAHPKGDDRARAPKTARPAAVGGRLERDSGASGSRLAMVVDVTADDD